MSGTEIAHSAPRVFISYAWEGGSEGEAREWVAALATKLRDNGVDVFDQWDSHPGKDLPSFMAREVRESDFVLVICTPAFAARQQLAGEIADELAKSAHDSEVAKTIARRAGIPSERLPEFKIPIGFWSNIVEQATHGVIRLDPLVDEALRYFPYNEEFIDIKRRMASINATPNVDHAGQPHEPRATHAQALSHARGIKGRLVPLLRSGETENALPSFLRGQYVFDFRSVERQTLVDAVADASTLAPGANQAQREASRALEELLRHFSGAPRTPRTNSDTTIVGAATSSEGEGQRGDPRDSTVNESGVFAVAKTSADQAIAIVVGAMLLLTLFVMWLSRRWGVDEFPMLTDGTTPEPGFLQQCNWYMYPLFWVILYLVVQWTWQPFIKAWRSLRRTGVMLKYEPGSRRHARRPNDEDVNAVIIDFQRWRWGMLIAAFVLGGTATWFDTDKLRTCYEKIDDDTAVDSLPRECLPEADFTIGFLGESPITETDNVVFDVLVYTMQAGAGSLALLALLQAMGHTILFFAVFEHLSEPKRRCLRLRLNVDDVENREFGLYVWNEALNYGCLYVAFGMVIPAISAHAHRWHPPNFGQNFLIYTLPSILAVFVVGAYYMRVSRRTQVRREHQGDRRLSRLVHTNSLWPFGRTWWGLPLWALALLMYAYIPLAHWIYRIYGW